MVTFVLRSHYKYIGYSEQVDVSVVVTGYKTFSLVVGRRQLAIIFDLNTSNAKMLKVSIISKSVN